MVMNLEKLLKQIESLVKINSVSSPIPELDQSNHDLVTQIQGQVRELGMDAKVISVNGHLNLKENNLNEKFNLLAHSGKGQQGLILSGHTDTVPFEKEKWLSDPLTLTIKGKRAYGLGTCDMKSFFPIVLAAFQDLQAKKGKPKNPLHIIGTSDEESSMNGMRFLVRRGGLQAKLAILGEPTRLVPVYMHKGIMMGKIILKGKSGHSSNPSFGISALEGMLEISNEILAWRAALQKKFYNRAFSVPFPTINLGRIKGGDSANRICAECELSLDIRYLPEMNGSELQHALSSIVKKISVKRRLHWEFSMIFEAIEPLRANQDSGALHFLEKVSGKKGISVNFGTEAPFYQSLEIPALVFGPGDIKNAHGANEFITLAQIQRAYIYFFKIIDKYCY
jgi:acetylornithine deacetylase